MNNRPLRRFALLACGLLLVLMAAPCVLGGLVWREWRQEKLDRALIMAIQASDTAQACTLLQQGANANAEDQQKAPSVRAAIYKAFSRLGRGRSQSKVLATSTALWLAVDRDRDACKPYTTNMPLLRALVEHGAEVNIEDERGWTPLLCETCAYHMDAILLLLEHGARADIRSRQGAFPLLFAVGRKDVFLVQTLLDHGANVNAAGTLMGIEPSSEVTALMNSQSVAVDRLLLDRGANVNAQDRCGETALMVAAHCGNSEIVKLLLQRHADPNHQTPYYSTALSRARTYNHPQIVRLLQQAGARK